MDQIITLLKGRRPTPKNTHPNKNSLHKQFAQTLLFVFCLFSREKGGQFAQIVPKLFVQTVFIWVGGFLGWVSPSWMTAVLVGGVIKGEWGCQVSFLCAGQNYPLSPLLEAKMVPCPFHRNHKQICTWNRPKFLDDFWGPLSLPTPVFCCDLAEISWGCFVEKGGSAKFAKSRDASVRCDVLLQFTMGIARMGALNGGLRPLSASRAHLSAIVHFCGLLKLPFWKRNFSLTMVHLIGCTRRWSYSAKGVFLPSKRLLRAFYTTPPPSKNPSKNLCLYWNPYKTPRSTSFKEPKRAVAWPPLVCALLDDKNPEPSFESPHSDLQCDVHRRKSPLRRDAHCGCDLRSCCRNPLRCRPRCKHHCECDAAMWWTQEKRPRMFFFGPCFLVFFVQFEPNLSETLKRQF